MMRDWNSIASLLSKLKPKGDRLDLLF
jgi:hypothetical protein